MTLFTLVKWLHVMAAIVAVGTNVTYGVWLSRASRAPESLLFTLRTIKLLDNRLANPCYALLLITGLAMAFIVPYPLTTSWILSALVLYAAVFVLGIAVFSPTFRQQIRLAESDGPDSETYQAVARRSATLGIVIGIITAVIVFLMVAKPPLWGG
jgi:uncharacterized membrane protein